MRAFISQDMRLALLISFLGHLFCIFFVSIIFVPAGLQPKKHFSVYFLGSILEKTVSLPASPPGLQNNIVELPVEITAYQDLSYFNEHPEPSLPEKGKQNINSDYFTEIDSLKAKTPALVNLGSVEQLAKQRQIIFRPKFPKYPEWVKEDFRASQVIFNIYISTEGLVEQLICVQASGNPEIDAALARYVQGWRFAPVADHQGQWQQIKIALDANG